MSYVCFTILVIFTFLLLFFFNDIGKKSGLFWYIGLFSSILSFIIFKSTDILSFGVSLGVIVLMGIFVCNNIIIQRYGLDEVKKIIACFGVSYLLPMIILFLVGCMNSGNYDVVAIASFDLVFGYDINNFRLFIAGFISISIMLWLNGYVYYYIRKSANNLVFSNIGSMLIIQFIESILFIIIGYSFVVDGIVLFGMIVISYLVKVLLGFVGFIPTYLIVKRKDK